MLRTLDIEFISRSPEISGTVFLYEKSYECSRINLKVVHAFINKFMSNMVRFSSIMAAFYTLSLKQQSVV